MSRFVDESATKVVDFGACQCPGAPHESDFARVRSELSAVEAARFASAADAEGVAYQASAFVVEWNLLGKNGEPWEPSAEAVFALLPDTLTPLMAAIGESIKGSSRKLPNGSGAPSRASSRGSASRTRTIQPSH